MMKIKTLILLLVIAFIFSTTSIADTVDIRESLIPWEKTAPTHMVVFGLSLLVVPALPTQKTISPDLARLL